MLHPQAQALLRTMKERGVPPTHTLTPQLAREARAMSQSDTTVLRSRRTRQ